MTITTIFFDCDNTLVLSEALAFEACAELANEICVKYNIPQRFTGESLLKEFVGQNFRGMMLGLQKKYGFTMDQAELEDYVARELGAVTKKLEAKATECPGATVQVKRLAEEKKYKLAVVSSSAISRVKASIQKVGMDAYFRPDWVYSAATSLPKPTSKPDPAIYFYACEQVGSKPGECVTIEDSRSGATAAKNAKIPLIGYVGPYPEDEKEHMRKVLKDECGALVIMEDWNEFPELLKQVEAAVA